MAKKALLVGLNRYPDPQNALNGCINDVQQVAALLADRHGFDADGEIRLLTDERATTAAIVGRLKWLLKGARAGDVLVFHYSGHGAQVRDREGDELADGLDEIICPYDLDWDDPFTDDDLYAIVKDLPVGVNLTVVLDCCHAGTGLRGPAGPARPLRARCLRPPADIDHRPTRDVALRRFGERASRSGAILLAACRDDQASADAYIDGDYHGAFTYCLCESVAAAGPEASYRDLIAEVRRRLRDTQFDQVPQLEGPAELIRLPAFAPQLVGSGRA
jgi:metacaspase-1